MKKTLWILLSLLLVLFCMVATVSCDDDVCEHEWGAWETTTAATCTAKGVQTRTCTKCAAPETQEIAALGHTGGTATCAAKAVCTTCNTAYGELLAHDWNAATCTVAKTCKVCSATEGNTLGHTGGTATCTAKAVCTTCNTAYGDLLAHDWNAATCTAPKTCKNCPATEGDALGHTGGTATCTAKAVCTTCNTPYGDLLAHDWNAATCTAPKTCKNCPATEGEALAHDWNAATCTAPKTCKNCPATEGDPLGHTGERTTCNVQAICTRCSTPFGEVGHIYNVKNAASAYIKTPATCDAPATYYYSCEHGEKGTEIFTGDSALGHDYVYESNGDGTHTAICLNDNTHTKTEDCSGGEATCTDPAECEICKEPYGEALGHDWVADPVTLSNTSCTEDIHISYHCTACPATKTEIEDAPGHSYENTVTPPTCAVPGYTTHTCTACGASYTDTPVAATGAHAWDADRTCSTGHACTVCGTTEPELGHDYVKASTPATCTAAAFDTFTCSVCNDEYTVVTADALGHDIAGVTPTEVSTEGCDYRQYYKCKTCGEDIEGDIVTRHKYVASVIDATCKTDGATVLTCSACNDTQSTPIPADGTAHLWSAEGTKSGDKLIYECTVDGCDETKSVVDLSDKSEGELNVEDVTSNGVEFKDATMDVSQLTGEGGVLNGAEKVTLAAGKLEGTDLEDVKSGLTGDQLKQIGENPIFNFTMTDAAGNPISQFGDKKVTITVPYDPKTMGGDVDNIAIWFIADDGTLTAIEATYHNGFVTFQTNHFSRYTVTRLTPEERCELYGHNWATKDPVPATCTTEGYTLRVCIRCSLSEKYDTVSAFGHSYVETTTAPTCTTAGIVVKDCENCTHSFETTIPATGHNYVSETVSATCTEFGSITYTCQNEGCGDVYVETLPLLSHEMSSETMAPTCEQSGYTTYFCTNENCTYNYNDDYTKALGHSLVDAWEWDDNDNAIVTLSCERENCGHAFSETVETSSKTWNSTCKKAGRTVYTAKYLYNGVTYTETQTVTLPLADHTYDTSKLLHNADGHWYRCSFCGTAGESVAHAWDEENVTKVPTCVAEGEKTLSCVCGETKTESVAIDATAHAWLVATCVAPKTCSLCSATEGAALGHTWVDATCVAPKTCSVCSTTEGEALGHTWVAATCVAPKTCSACGATEGEALGHAWVDTVTAPTCTEAGYTTHVCSACNESFVDTPIPATGNHTYQNGACTQCGKAEPECEHQFDAGIVTLNPTCTAEGAKLLTCTKCGETKSEAIAIDKNAHAWVDATCEAPKTCKNCSATEGEALGHTYEDGKCTQCGKIETACDHSELTRTVVVDLSKHSVCGGTFSYLTCECGEIAVLPTDMFNIMEDMALGCEHITESDDTEWEDEDGNEFESIDFSCADCGLVVTATFCEIEETCREIDRFSLLFKVNGTAIMPEIVCEEVWEEHDFENYETEIIDLTQYGACGGTLEIYKCGDCGMLRGMDDPNFPNCKGEWIQNQVENEDGSVEYVMYFACTECGLVIDAGGKMYVENCETVMVSTVLVTCGDTVIFEMETKDGMGYAEHNWVGSAELAEGKTCEDGFVLTLTCADCGTSFTYSYNEHMPAILDREIDLTDYRACEGSIKFYTCPCGAYENVDVDSCANYNGSNSYEDEDGTPHYAYTYFCEKCGLAYMESHTYLREGCTENEYYVIAVGIGETVILEPYTYLYSSYEDHNYLYEFTLNGESCEDGYTYVATCALCGAVDTGSGKASSDGYHYTYPTAYYDLADHGMCGGYLKIYSCPCGKEVERDYSYDCDFSWDTESYEKDGVLHEVVIRACEKCGAKWTEDSYGVVDGCYEIRYAIINITVGETEVVKDLAYVSVQGSNHQYEYSEIKMNGTSCEDGYFYTATCKVCGEIDKGESHWHNSEFYYVHYDLAEYGACGGYIEYRSCACGAQSELIDDVACEYESEITPYEKDGVLHALQTVICRTCGLTITTDAYQVQEGCYESIYGTITIKVGEQTVVENLECVMFREENHDYEYTFELMGDSCEDGLRYQRICKTCGYGKDSSAFTYSHETFPTNSIDLAEYGACGGSIDFYACPCGYLSYAECNIECEWESNTDKPEKGKDGTEQDALTLTCATCGLQYTSSDYYTLEGCAEILYRTITVTVGEIVVLEDYKYAAERYENHTYEYRFEMYGESCEDGYVAHISCKNCDYSRTEKENYWHNTYENYYDLTKYGACGGYIRVSRCPCGENGGYPDHSFACNFSEAQAHTYVGEDGFTHAVSIWVCEDCGLTRTEDHYTVKEGCNLVTYKTMTVTVDGITVVDLDGLGSQEEQHEYNYNFIMQGESCEDGFTYTVTCKNCDYYDDQTWNTWYHHNTFGTKYYYFTEYSTCGSYLYEYTCPCGQNNGISTDFYSCDLSSEWDDYTDENGVEHSVEISTCQKCGLVFTHDRYAVREGCFDVYYCALTVTSGDVTLLDNLFYKERSEERHQFIYELTLNEGATSCEDGYTVVEKCAKCDYASEPWENSDWHTSYCVEYYDLAEHGACGGCVRVMSCACGETHYFDNNVYCEFESEETEYKDADGRKHTLYTNTCTACGLVWEQDHYTVREGCYDVHYVEYTFTVDGTAVISALKNVDGRSERHEYDYTFHLNGKSCNDGYTYVAVCKSCDYSFEGEGSWHTTYTMETYYLAEHGACGGYLERYTCACGESSGISWNIECDYEYEETSFEGNGVTHDVYTYTCATCGLEWVEDWYILREGCYDNTYAEMTVTVGDTVVVNGMKEKEYYNAYHKLAYTFQLNDGVSCENGYTYVATCQNCDYVTDGSGSYHDIYTTERYDLAEYGACGGEISLYTCACGKSKGVNYVNDCDYNSSTVENVVDGITHSVTTYVCNNCALVRICDSYTVREGCYYVTHYTYTYTVGDTVLVEDYEYVSSYDECHDYTYVFTVGDSCEDGYSYVRTCKNCDDTYEGNGYSHDTYRTQYYFLEDYGICPGYVRYFQCACGYNSYISTDFDCNTSHSSSSYEDASGVTHSVDTYACADCGMTRVSDYHTVTEGCYDIRYCDFTLVMGEETVVDALRYVSSRSNNHDLSYTLTLKDGATTCVDGYVALFRCKNCDYTDSEYGYSHNSYPTERYNLKDFGACGGYVEIRECACGENSYVNTNWHCNTNYTSNTYVDEDGYTHRVSTSTCNSCGMRYTEDSYAVKAADSCETTTYHTVMMNVGGTLVCDYRYTTTGTVHDYKVTGTTEDGVTCENGVTLTYECRYCDHSYTNHYTYHIEYELERVALDCDCGGYAAIRGCACGYYVSLNTSNWLCDAGWSYTDAFVENIVRDGQYNIPGSQTYINNSFRIYTCAVTDPVRCAYKIRVAEYYVVEDGCRVAYCVKYQFGYDEATGTYDDEYTLKTKQLETVHSFTETAINEAENGLSVTGIKYTCEKCGSYYYEKNYYDAALEKSVKNEYYFENKLDDGNHAFYHTVTEYDYTFDAGFGENAYAYTQTTSYPGYSYTEEYGYTSYRGYEFRMYEMTVYNRGTADETWSRYDYTYGFEGSCTRTTVFTNSSGTRTESTEEYHHSTTQKTDKTATCTQDGAYHYVCVFCEKTTYEGIYAPKGHSWVKLADEYYVCDRCGLENANGVSGSIVMEDLTKALGNGENYVVGYWNTTLVKFQYYVCLYLHEPNEYGDYQVDLTGITVNKLDGIRGYAFSKAEVAAAAEALGYTADQYEVMFVFVPEGADSSFDYAVIFTEDSNSSELS